MYIYNQVVPEPSEYVRACSEGALEKWVRVSEILPMSDYDLEAYSTYRHRLEPSSEFDLQRHDPSLLRLYRKTTNLDLLQ